MIATVSHWDESSRSEIAAIRAALERAENASDAEAASALLADDAVLIVPDHPVQEGRLACTAFLRELFAELAARYERHIRYTSDEVSDLGDVAFDRGTFAFTIAPRNGGDAERITGKYLWILRRDPQRDWRVTRLVACRDDEEGFEPEAPERAVPILPGDDLAAARDFYVGKLGFTVQFEASDDRINGLLGLQRGGMELTIDCPMSGHGRHACVSLRVNSADAFYQEWRHVVEIPRPPTDEPWGGRTFGFQDPFGNSIFVIGPTRANEA